MRGGAQGSEALSALFPWKGTVIHAAERLPCCRGLFRARGASADTDQRREAAKTSQDEGLIEDQTSGEGSQSGRLLKGPAAETMTGV